MPFDDEPRSNAAYVAMKAHAAELLSPEEARIMLFLIYPELNADKTPAAAAELEQVKRELATLQGFTQRETGRQA